VTARVRWDDVEVGTELPARTFPVDRAALVRYAGASGDFNVIHWNERVATAVGLPNVIAHGMLTMALGGRVVTDWAGDPGAVVEYGVRFTRPVVVPDDDTGATIEVTGTVSRKDDEGVVQVTLTVRSEGSTVLGKAQALVRLA
jgi:acyl dehydratase